MEDCPVPGILGNNMIPSTSVQTSIPRPSILFIDGLPGSGKSTAAEAVGGRLSNSRVFAETAPNRPLLVAAPRPDGRRVRGHSRDALRRFVCRCGAREAAIVPGERRM